MNAHLKLAYQIGAATARERFKKEAAGADIATPIAGSLGALPAALVGGLTSPEGRGFAGGAGAGGGALLGQIGGAVGGGALGALGGAGLAKLYNALQERRGLWDRLTDYRHMDPGKATAAGAGLGSLLGGLSGGAYGAYKGRRAGVGEQGEDTENKEGSAKFARAPHDASDVASAALGGIPLVGPAAAGLASGMSGPRGLRQTTGMATTGGAAAGQALGGLGGAAVGAGLGAGGAALYNALKRDPTLWERITGGGPQDVDVGKATGLGALIGGGIGTVGGGVLGAHQGRGYGEERGERRDAIKAQIIQAMRQRAAQRQIMLGGRY